MVTTPRVSRIRLTLHSLSIRLNDGELPRVNSARLITVYFGHMGDIRLGFRLLWKDTAFTVTAVLTLALCIGANVAVFSIVHNVLLKPLPVPQSDRIVLMGNAYPGAGSPIPSNSAVPDYFDRLRYMDVFEEQADYTGGTQSVDQNGTPVRVRMNRVTPSFFRLLRVAPVLGRTFSEEEGEIGKDTTVVLSYALWHSQFGGDPAVVGKDLRLDGQPVTVIGVMPRDFYFLNPDVLLWRPIAFTPEQKSDELRHSNNFQNIGRLKPGATIARAQQQVDAINARNLELFPAMKPVLINAGFHTSVEPLQDTLVRDIKPSLYLMWGGALFVLLIGCVNVANLVLVRSRARLRDHRDPPCARRRPGPSCTPTRRRKRDPDARVGGARAPRRLRVLAGARCAEYPGPAARHRDPA